jgi:predicted TIM-barrel fold metal-dependent hydrolase
MIWQRVDTSTNYGRISDQDHTANQKESFAMERFLVIDADGHVEESSKGLQKYLRPENRGRPLWTSDSWDRNFGGALGKTNEDPHVQLEDMDADGIDIQVVYPTRGISLSAAREVDLAVDLARAYNDWLADFCSVNPARLKGVALVALQDVAAAVRGAPRGRGVGICRCHDADQCA